MKYTHTIRAYEQVQPAREIKVQKFSVGSPDLTSRISNIEHILDNMSHASGTSVLLGGSTGIGKTTMIKQLGKLLGLNVELVEVPHITEEKLINIPFVVYKPDGSKAAGTDSVNTDNASVEIARSHLATILASMKPVSDSEYMSNVKKFDANTKAMYNHLGGTETEIPDEIVEIRKKYRTILFLDEYWRQTSMNVRNILRNILNGRIGNDRIPRGVYVIFASNISDVGQSIENIPSNADFKTIKLKPPTKDEFFHFLTSAAQAAGIQLHDVVLHSFYDAIDNKHISYDDITNEIRTSPRRWEQIVHYVNAAIPISSESEAKSLLANVKAMFRNEKATSELHKLVDEIVRKIIELSGTPEFKNVKANNDTEWRDTFEHQIAMKKKLGETRTYIPILMGPPGIGKTTEIHQIAERQNLLPIVISSDTLSADEITGIPLAKKDQVTEAKKQVNNKSPDTKSTRMGVTFSEPPLYIKIMQDAEEEKQAFLADPNISDERKAAWKKQHYKYLLFFDELNRVGSQNTFNNLRRVILDKSFNDQVKLPDSMMIVAAMNPSDLGVQELTHHMKDAVDLIQSEPSWSSFENYLRTSADGKMKLNKFPEVARQIAKKILTKFADTFSIKRQTENINLDSRKFYISLGEGNIVYISPREYASLYAELVAGISRALKKKSDIQNSLSNVVFDKIDQTLETILQKYQIGESPHILLKIEGWVKAIIRKILEKNRTAPSLEHMLEKAMRNPQHHLADDPNFVRYVENFQPSKFTEEIHAYVTKLVNQERKKYEILIRDTVNKKQYLDGTVIILNDLVDKLYFIASEISIAVKKLNLSGDILDFLEEEYDTIVKNLFEDFETPATAAYHNELKKINLMISSGRTPREKDPAEQLAADKRLKADTMNKARQAIEDENLSNDLTEIINRSIEKITNFPFAKGSKK